MLRNDELEARSAEQAAELQQALLAESIWVAQAIEVEARCEVAVERSVGRIDDLIGTTIQVLEDVSMLRCDVEPADVGGS